MGSLADHIMLAIPGPGSVNEKLIAFFGGGGILQPQSVSTSALVVRALSGQTADLTQWQNSAGTVLAKVPASGGFDASGAGGGAIRANYDTGFVVGAISISGYGAVLQGDNATNIPLIVKGRVGQTADLQQWQDSTGVAVARLAPDASFYLVNSNGSTKVSFRRTAEFTMSDDGGRWQARWPETVGAQQGLVSRSDGRWAIGIDATAAAQLTVQNRGATSDVGIIVRGVASQTADLQQWQNSAGVILFRVAADGLLARGPVFESYLFNPDTGGGATMAFFAPTATNTKVLVIRGLAAQTDDLQQWQNSAGTALILVSADGMFRGNNQNSYLFGTSTYQAVMQSSAIGQVVLLAKGFAGQTADLQQWQDSVGTVFTSVTAVGLLKWNAAANQQTTVGLAGAASALPLTPAKYLKVVDSAGTTLVIPAYNP